MGPDLVSLNNRRRRQHLAGHGASPAQNSHLLKLAHAYLLHATEAAIALPGTVTFRDVLAAAAERLPLRRAYLTHGARRGDTNRTGRAANQHVGRGGRNAM